MRDVKNIVHSGCVVDAMCLYSWIHNDFCFHQVADVLFNNLTYDDVFSRDIDYMIQTIRGRIAQ